MELIGVTNDEGGEETWVVLGRFTDRGNEYLLLLPFGGDTANLVRLEGDEDDPIYSGITDKAEFKRVSKIAEAMLA